MAGTASAAVGALAQAAVKTIAATAALTAKMAGLLLKSKILSAAPDEFGALSAEKMRRESEFMGRPRAGAINSGLKGSQATIYQVENSLVCV